LVTILKVVANTRCHKKFEIRYVQNIEMHLDFLSCSLFTKKIPPTTKTSNIDSELILKILCDNFVTTVLYLKFIWQLNLNPESNLPK